jgi:2-dehydropantoate 2-reductase
MHDDVPLALWEKWVFLAALAAMTCAMRGSIGQILATDHGLSQIRATLDECNAVAIAEGKTPTETQRAYFDQLMTDPKSTMTASMLRDMEAGGPIEADHIIGDMVRRAETHGIDVPNLKTALTKMQVHEGQVRAM